MSDSAKKMREAIKRFHRNCCYPEAFDFEVDGLMNELAALSASGTKSDGGHGGQPYASTDAVEGASAPNALSGRQEGRTGGVVGATQTPGSSMSSGQTKPITAGQAPGPSDPIPSQPDELEAIAETIWRAEYRRATGRERSIPWSEVSIIDRERYRYVATAILAMQAERRGVKP